MKYTPLLLAGMLLAAQAPAQAPDPCTTNDEARLERLTAHDPALRQLMAQSAAELEAFTEAFIAGMADGERETKTIPVVFHIIHNNGPENIPNENVHDAMRILNEDFNKENPDWPQVQPTFLPLVADVDVEFVLARKDPQGNCTNGITRTVSGLTHEGEESMKALIQWPRNKYLNVWVCANAGGSGVLGYTYTPNNAQFMPTQDGIVVRYNALGTLPPANSGFSRTLTHEVGHWINLQHTWGGSNTPGLQSNCNMDDGVADTPNTTGYTSGCNLSASSCDGTLDNVENYMDYTDCSRMFTNGQKARMLAALNSGTASRNQLWTAANLAATGVSTPATLCAAAMLPGPKVICEGNSITFTDISYNLTTGRTWSFPGGNPATSTAANPTVTYDTPGTYNVVLTAINGAQQVTTTSTAHVTVVAGQDVPLTEGFETYASLDDSPWTVINPMNSSFGYFELTDLAAYAGTKSARMRNHAMVTGQVHELISGSYDMSGVDEITINYRYAYARRNSSSNDRLRVFVSNNCGENWSLRQMLTGGYLLNTVGAPISGGFVPTADQWAGATATAQGSFVV
ncbi:MAG: M43 family zinc metalloprotease, partial [Flavobacteriales bacterium]|nr:M43 family zinc metalloprotease [Flavobacteriales bacterium]